LSWLDHDAQKQKLQVAGHWTQFRESRTHTRITEMQHTFCLVKKAGQTENTGLFIY